MVNEERDEMLELRQTGGASGKEAACPCRRRKRRELDPWVGKILWRRGGNPLQYSCLENPQGQRDLVGCSPWGCKESDINEAS